MKKKLTRLSLLSLGLLLIGCSNDDSEKQIEVTLQEQYEVSTLSVLDITASDNSNNPNYEWTLIKNPVNQTTDSIVGNTKDLKFIALHSGTYELTLSVTEANKKTTKKTVVNVINETKNYNPYITSIFDFAPAPGMFANEFYTVGNSKTQVMQIALSKINETSTAKPIDLGGFGGSIVIGFDHTIINIAGQKDFRVFGGDISNPTVPKGNPPAPGLIYVAYDKNKNGKPDEDEWYEIIGSQHTKGNTIKNFKITYYKPVDGKPLVSVSRLWIDNEHLYCENNQDEKYYMEKPSGAKKDFYPALVSENTMVFEGLKLDVDFKSSRPNQTTLWNSTFTEWGYVNSINPDIDIDWAVDKNGNKANLPGIDFIKVVNCVSEPMGRCAQQSSMATQFSGAADLHLIKKYNLEIVKK